MFSNVLSAFKISVVRKCSALASHILEMKKKMKRNKVTRTLDLGISSTISTFENSFSLIIFELLPCNLNYKITFFTFLIA